MGDVPPSAVAPHPDVVERRLWAAPPGVPDAGAVPAPSQMSGVTHPTPAAAAAAAGVFVVAAAAAQAAVPPVAPAVPPPLSDSSDEFREDLSAQLGAHMATP